MTMTTWVKYFFISFLLNKSYRNKYCFPSQERKNGPPSLRVHHRCDTHAACHPVHALFPFAQMGGSPSPSLLLLPPLDKYLRISFSSRS